MGSRLLWVTDEVPDADLGGGSIRQYHLLRRLAERVDVDLLLVGQLRDDDLRRRLRQVRCLPRPPALMEGWGTTRRRLHNLATMLPGRPPSDVAVAGPVVAALRAGMPDTSDYDVVQLEHEHLAGLLPGHRPNRWAMTMHNVLSVRYRQRAQLAANPRLRRLWEADARRAEAWERRIVSGFDLTVAMSAEDAAILGRAAAPGRHIPVVANGVDLERFSPSPIPADPVMIFSASFNYEPNIDGATWACEEVLPLVREKVPSARLLLVGREPNDRVRRLAGRPGVEGHFDVPAIPPYLRSARVALVAVRQGSGTRLKGLEAMAAGRPLVGTATGLEGLSLEDGRSALIADTADDLAAAVVRVLEDDDVASRLARAARSVAEDRFGWDRLAGEYLDQLGLGAR